MTSGRTAPYRLIPTDVFGWRVEVTFRCFGPSERKLILQRLHRSAQSTGNDLDVWRDATENDMRDFQNIFPIDRIPIPAPPGRK